MSEKYYQDGIELPTRDSQDRELVQRIAKLEYDLSEMRYWAKIEKNRIYVRIEKLEQRQNPLNYVTPIKGNCT